ncbi:dTDP-glucose 4,6-dehydratase [Metabacillus fastidiosus]|uniref:dTDP-glucose 4,6-dehydratase n=1 Tax=Metabacillus fastidiosus TaxID=1458 RepID=UPI002E2202D2|nr:dTDP-glucose 4,6-dehydratase [Metabacillus fastidiosus]MED4454443.1 dTDP-glucose 4,6-dehydratase [Metabacillus fastidiosus]
MKDSLNKKVLLITGGAGFIGSNFLEFLLKKYSHYKLINIDNLTYAGNLENLVHIETSNNYTFIKGDICNRELLEHIFNFYDIRGVIHFAAESHVDNSITSPNNFIRTNIIGTFTLLEVARSYWMMGPGKYKKGYEDCRFHHISTDEVYGSLGKEGFFTERSPYAPRSPYSASKASSDMIVKSYYHTYGLNIIITNCSNNYGPKQAREKFIPKIIESALNYNSIPVYGDGTNVRDWLYVTDHCRGIDVVYHFGKIGETYNIGGNNERQNNYVVEKVCEILDEIIPLDDRENNGIKSFKDLISYVKDRPGHDRRYAVDTTKISQELGWRPVENFEETLRETVIWYTGDINRKVLL